MTPAPTTPRSPWSLRHPPRAQTSRPRRHKSGTMTNCNVKKMQRQNFAFAKALLEPFHHFKSQTSAPQRLRLKRIKSQLTIQRTNHISRSSPAAREVRLAAPRCAGSPTRSEATPRQLARSWKLGARVRLVSCEHIPCDLLRLECAFGGRCALFEVGVSVRTWGCGRGEHSATTVSSGRCARQSS